ncbi:MAG TPA: hypothetical protein VFZ49_06340 [Pyrinomonadaceae bacterium]
MPKLILRSVCLFAAAVLGGFSVSAQDRPVVAAPSYEATLFVLVGSDDSSQRGDLPRSLDTVSKQIRDSFSFRNYRLMNTYYGRLADSGSLDYKSVSSLKTSTELDSPTFLDWQLAKFQANAAGSNVLNVELFRFGARVPVHISNPGRPEASIPVTNYESVGLTLNKLSLKPNSPTLIGTISLPRTTGTIFLVMTISPVS